MHADRALAATPRPGSRPDGGPVCVRSAAAAPLAPRDPYARLARGCRPRGC
ncbi:tryptophan synthase subunit(beta), partial [Streptomyces montanus]